ncbi:M4 family metallopeptidase [Microbulbifer sp. 2304DJ12-6]|uniref:M4 family metallopeptidase n=1 Tax=Microbulbifer sp. 2304DJ12-6 TaxID=3233340 RepID=UPI0039AFE5FB
MRMQLLGAICILIIATGAQAAGRVPVTPEILKAQDSARIASDMTFDIVRSRVLPNGKRITRLRQTHWGIPIWGQTVTRSGEGSGAQLYGDIVTGLHLELPKVQPEIKPEQALERAMTRSTNLRMQQNPLSNALPVSALKLLSRNQSQELYIYIDYLNRARLSYLVNWVEYGDQISRPFYFIDALSGEVLEHWEGINHLEATGPGGNEKTGQYLYGIDFPSLQVDNDCRMDTTNVETVNMEHKREGGTVFQFTCPNNTYKAINGAYSPLNDAHFFGNVISNMYTDWYGIAPLTHKMRLQVHYGEDYVGANWDGTQMNFGDGAFVTYPLVSLDVIAHEVAHGFTEQNSHLSIWNQPGGINESFSDIAGEAAEFYLHGSNDWLVGQEITRNEYWGRDAIRYFQDPTLDDYSIGHASDYQEGFDPHGSSGVFNRAFYLMANSSGWDTRHAFDLFVLANQMYWNTDSSFIEGACGVLFAANDLGYDAAVVVNAFDIVGVPTASCASN